MSNTFKQVENIFNLNTKLFMNAIDGVTEDQAKERISDHNNPLNWLTTHTVWARFNTCMLLGNHAVKNPYAGMFENFKPYDPNFNYPTLADNKKEWNNATKLLTEAIDNVSEAHLAADSPWKSPIGDNSNAGTLAFLAQHESYDIGQIAFLKKYFTKEPMKY